MPFESPDQVTTETMGKPRANPKISPTRVSARNRGQPTRTCVAPARAKSVSIWLIPQVELWGGPGSVATRPQPTTKKPARS